MAITLRIDNFDQMTDGGPIEFTAGPRGFDIGRESHLDWCLPDPNRVISGHHAQIRYENGEYLLNDVSRNGTFVNGNPGRVQSPYRLANGDRLQIGHYYISVAITGGGGASAQPMPQQMPRQQDFEPAQGGGDIWGGAAAAPEPVDRRWFANQQRRGSRAPDAFEQFVDMSPKQAQSPFGNDYGGLGQPMPNLPPSRIAEQGPAPGFGGTGVYPAPAGRPAPGGMPMPGGMPAGGQMAGQGGGPLLAVVANAAGINPQVLASRGSDEVANELGQILRIVTEQLSVLLVTRAKAKQITKSSNRTMIGADNNNPLKFIPDTREALEIMFQRNRPGYMGAAQSVKEGFEDIKRHELATFAAMQKALMRLMEDLTPEKIEDKAASAAFANKKARAWEIYVERWQAKTEHHENGILDVFLGYFADAYDEAAKR